MSYIDRYDSITPSSHVLDARARTSAWHDTPFVTTMPAVRSARQRGGEAKAASFRRDISASARKTATTGTCVLRMRSSAYVRRDPYRRLERDFFADHDEKQYWPSDLGYAMELCSLCLSEAGACVIRLTAKDEESGKCYLDHAMTKLVYLSETLYAGRECVCLLEHPMVVAFYMKQSGASASDVLVPILYRTGTVFTFNFTDAPRAKLEELIALGHSAHMGARCDACGTDVRHGVYACACGARCCVACMTKKFERTQASVTQPIHRCRCGIRRSASDIMESMIPRYVNMGASPSRAIAKIMALKKIETSTMTLIAKNDDGVPAKSYAEARLVYEDRDGVKVRFEKASGLFEKVLLAQAKGTVVFTDESVEGRVHVLRVDIGNVAKVCDVANITRAYVRRVRAWLD